MEKKNINLLVIETESSTLFETVRKLNLVNVKIKKTDSDKASEAYAQFKPEMVIFATEPDKVIPASDWLHFAPLENPEAYWVLSSSKSSPTQLVEFMRTGVRDFLSPVPEAQELEDLFERFEIWKNRQMPQAEAKKQHVISVFSSKGGVGQSLLATNLAVELTRCSSGRVLLADFVLQHGNVAELLDINTNYSLTDMADNLERLDQKLIENTITRHESGLFVLPCPKQPEDSDGLDAQLTEDLIRMLSSLFPCLVLDLGHELYPHTLTCLDHSDLIYVITTPDLPSLCNTRSSLETFSKLGYSRNKCKLIPNRSGLKGCLSEEQVSKNLNYPIFLSVKDDTRMALMAINQGTPWRKLDKRAEIVRTLEQLAKKIIVPEPVEKSDKKEKVHELA